MIILILFALATSPFDASTIECNYKFSNFKVKGVKPDIVMNDVYFCGGELSSNCDSRLRVIGVSSNHLPNKSLRDVQELALQNQHIPVLPKGLREFFPYISILFLARLGLEAISPDDLNYPRLRFLILKENNLESFSSDIFQHVPNLELLDLHDNPVTILGNNILNPVPKVRTLFLYNTACFGKWPHGNFHDFEKVNQLRQMLKTNCKPRRIENQCAGGFTFEG